MPLVRVAMLKGKSPDYIEAVSNSIHRALVEKYETFAHDRFQIIDQLDPNTLIFDRHFLGGPRSGDFLLISVTDGPRTRKVKEAFYQRLVEALAESPGVRPEDVLIHLDCTTSAEDWSFSNGLSAARLLDESRH